MSAHGPQPTDHDPEPGCTLNRREFAKAVGAAAAIGGGVAASSRTARAQPVSGIASAVSPATRLGYAIGTTSPVGAAGITAAVAFHKLKDSIESSPTADKLILYQMATSEFKSLSQHEVTFRNRITDGRSVAHLEARHGIATGWENGDSASQAYDRALSLVRQYWELPEFNHIHITNKSLLQLKYIAETARSSGFDSFAIADIADGSDGNSYQVRFSGETQEVDYTLHDGTSISNVNPDETEDVLGDYDSAALETPILEFYDDSAGEVVGTAPAISNSVVDSWGSGNPPEGQVRYSPDDSGGTTFDTSLEFVMNSVGDEPSTVVFEGAEFFKILDLIHTNSDGTVATYDVSLVKDLYGELEAGNITPEQVRGPEGMTRYLSGTDDPTHPKFRMALLANLGMQQPDFTRVAQMGVDWTGATGKRVDTDPNLSERHVYPDEFVTDQSYSGALFGRDLPEGGFDPESEYLVGPPVYYCDFNGNLGALDAVSGEFQREFTPGGADAVAISHDCQTVFAGDGNGVTKAFDASDGTEKWSSSADGNELMNLYVSDDGETLYGGGYSNAFSLNISDGSENWTHSPSGNCRDLAFHPDMDYIVMLDGDGTVKKLDPSDGSELASATFSFNYNGSEIAMAPDASHMVAVGYGGAYGIDPSDLSQMWSSSGGGSQGNFCECTADYQLTCYGGTLVARDPSDGSEIWSHSLSNGAQSLTYSPVNNVAYVGTEGPAVVAVQIADSATNVEQLWSYSLSSGVSPTAIAFPQVDVDGIAGSAMMFDEGSGDEVTLRDGVVTVTEMTDSGGDRVTHVDETTISDLESLSGTPDSVDTIVSEMDEFDSAEDIEYIRDVETVLDHYGVEASIGGEGDGADITVQDTDYSRPGYGTTSSAEFAEKINSLEKKVEQLKAEENGGGGGDLFGGLFSGDNFGGGSFVGLAIIGVVVLAVVGFVTDMIPGMGGN